MRLLSCCHYLLLVEMAALAPLSGVRFGRGRFLQTFGWYVNDLVVEAAPILVLSFGMTAVLMSGGIDLSVGSMTALVACVMATFEPGRQFWLTAVPVGLGARSGLGLVQRPARGGLRRAADHRHAGNALFLPRPVRRRLEGDQAQPVHRRSGLRPAGRIGRRAGPGRSRPDSWAAAGFAGPAGGRRS